MNMEDYIDTLKGQIRDKNAKSFVANEIRSHIEEQADVYENGGLSRDDALEKALRRADQAEKMVYSRISDNV